MRKVKLTIYEESKYKIIKKWIDNNGTNYKSLSLKLNCSLKTAYNYVKGYRKEGKPFFRHGNHDNKPVTMISSEIKNKIITIYQEIGDGINFNHFKDTLKRDYSITVSYGFLYNLLMQNELSSPKCQRKTRKDRKKRIQQRLTPIEEDLVNNHLLDSHDAYPRKERAKYIGKLVQMDASEHLRFGNRKTHLHAAIDDCTGNVIGTILTGRDIKWILSYYNQFLGNYGFPRKF